VGYPLQSRTYDAGTTQKYKFTGKERDVETAGDGVTGYDYFGARYYDSRIANWNSVDPMLSKHYDWSPYDYVLRNPLGLIDPEGKQDVIIEGAKAVATTVTIVAESVGAATAAEFAVGTIIVASVFVPTSALGTNDVLDPPLTINVPPLESSDVTKSRTKDVLGQINTIRDHINEMKKPNDPNWNKHKGDIEKHIPLLVKAAEKLGYSARDMIQKLINQGKLKADEVQQNMKDLEDFKIENIKQLQ